MKTLIVIRHAKSSWADSGLSDFDRPLNDRGKRDAPEMARRILQKKINIDLFISSPAKRAKKTAQIFADELGAGPDKVVVFPELYLASSVDFITAISKSPSNTTTIAVFSHNPGITEFVNTLTDVRIDDMPTCAVFAVTVDAEDWSGFEQADKKFLFFDYPKLPQT
jgi:phosphohistidine phosphatase